MTNIKLKKRVHKNIVAVMETEDTKIIGALNAYVKGTLYFCNPEPVLLTPEKLK